MPPSLGERVLSYLNGLVFVSSLVVGGILFVLLPKQTISVEEKRALAGVPTWSLDRALSGAFTHDIDTYYSDNFIFRGNFLILADIIKQSRGFHYSGIQQIETPKGPPTKLAVGSVAPRAPDEDNDYESINSIILYHGRAVQISTGSDVTAARFANLINTMHQDLGAGVRIYCMAIPVGSDFYLPHEVNHGVMREQHNIESLYADLAPGVIPVRAYDELDRHTAEYIQFRTDHHWTGLGAYYAYLAFAKAAGLSPLPLRAMTHRQIDGFLGSLYYHTRDEDLKKNPDVVDYYMVPFSTEAYIYSNNSQTALHAKVYQETAHGGNAYGVFIGGDHPLMKIVSSVGGGRKILVIKDSYGNAFVPYLAAHYQEIYVVDYRYFEGNLRSFVQEHGIGEVLVAHNTYVLNGRYAVVRAEHMLRG
jgi:hypothetical protein